MNSYRRLKFALTQHAEINAAPPDTPAAVISRQLISPTVAVSLLNEVLKVSQLGAFEHKKAPQDFLRRFPKMERAKRLELGNQSSDAPTPSEVADSAPPADTQLSTQAGLELAEIVSAWPQLRPEIRTAVLTLVRMAAGVVK